LYSSDSFLKKKKKRKEKKKEERKKKKKRYGDAQPQYYEYRACTVHISWKFWHPMIAEEPDQTLGGCSLPLVPVGPR